MTYFQFSRGIKVFNDEKEWLCREVTQHPVPPIWQFQITKKKKLILRYNLDAKFFKRNLKIHNDPNKFFVDHPGRPSSLDQGSLLVVGKTIRKFKADNGSDMTVSQVRNLFDAEHRETMKRSQSFDSKFKSLDSRTFKKLRKTAGIATQQGDMHTEARDIACKCPRGLYVWWLIVWSLYRFIGGVQKWNGDATTYVFLAKYQNEKSCGIVDDGMVDELLKAMDKEEEEEEEEMADVNNENRAPGHGRRKKAKFKKPAIAAKLPFAIKNMHLSNSFGECGPPFLILANKDMPKNSYFLYPVPGLSWQTGTAAVGFVAISRTRCGTSALWAEWYKKVLFPTVTTSYNHHMPTSVSPNYFDVDLLLFRCLFFCFYIRQILTILPELSDLVYIPLMERILL